MRYTWNNTSAFTMQAIYANLYYNFSVHALTSKNKTPTKYNIKRRDEVCLEA